MYPSLQQKAARLCFGLVKKHPFVDGNKRISAHAMLVFLALNEIELQHTQTELEVDIFCLEPVHLLGELSFVIGICLYIEFIRYIEAIPRIFRKGPS